MEKLSRVNAVPDYLKDPRFESVRGVLSREPSSALKRLISLLSSKVIVGKDVVDRLRELATRGPVVYAMKYRNLYDLQLLRLMFANLGIPVPCFAFDISAIESGDPGKVIRSVPRDFQDMVHRKSEHYYPTAIYREILERGGAGVFFLVDEKTSRGRYVHPQLDPLKALFDIQSSIAASISVVPLMILYDRSPKRSIKPFGEVLLGDPDQPGLLRRILIAARKWTVPELLAGEPVYLVGEFEEFGSDVSWEEGPFNVRKKLIAAINERIRVSRGPEKYSRTEIKELVLQDPSVQDAVLDVSSKLSVSEEQARKKAESFVQEMAADQRIQFHHFLYHVLKWIFSKIFDGVDYRQSDFVTLKKANEQGSLVFVSCHKSHVDYLLIGFLSFINQMTVPHMAGGKNLSFWPLGPILRNSGAFFIRRSFKALGDYSELYTNVFDSYLRVLVDGKNEYQFLHRGRQKSDR